ncbi:hypothetical protein [Peribacillus simplex]|uniref:hypothetical protein n=1 Tax=Peribacillus simplex TaxID=1478 RepID=UPI00367130E3
MDALVVGLLFLIPGIIFFILVLLKYTKEEHWKEVKKWKWIRNDTYASWSEQDMILFHKIASKSYIAAKIILILSSIIPVVIGAFALWVFFS